MRKIVCLFLFIASQIGLFANVTWHFSETYALKGKVFYDKSKISNRTYFEPKNITKFIVDYKVQNILIKLALGNKNNCVDFNSISDNVTIDSLLALYKPTENVTIGVLKCNLATGKNSYIFNSSINSDYYDKFLSEVYFIDGLTFSQSFKNWNLGLNLGANGLNKEVTNIIFSYKKDRKILYKLYYLWVVRDNLYNRKKNTLSLEASQTIGKFYFDFLSEVVYYPANSDAKEKSNNRYFAEIVYFPNKTSSFGVNYFYNEYYSAEKRYNFYSDFKFLEYKLKMNLQYYVNDSSKIDKRIGFEFQRSFKPTLTFGILSYAGKSFNDRNYLDLGIYIKFNYE